MFRLLFSHLQVVVLCKLRILLLAVFRFPGVAPCITSVVVCLVSLELVYLYCTLYYFCCGVSCFP
jgi:hypothetical protein